MQVVRHTSADAVWELARTEPAAALRGLVQELVGYDERGTAPVRRRELPSGGVPLVLSFGPDLEVDGARLGSFVAGVHDAPSLTEHAGESRGVEVLLTPLGARRLLGRPMHELTGRAVDVRDVLGPDAARLGERLHGLATWEARTALVEDLLLRRFAAAPSSVAGELTWAWHRLLRSGGTVEVRALAAEVGWSPKRLGAAFRDGIGLAPKRAARVVRFDRAQRLLRGGAPLADVAYACGYSDQPHFTREVRALSGLSPGALRAAVLPAGWAA